MAKLDGRDSASTVGFLWRETPASNLAFTVRKEEEVQFHCISAVVGGANSERLFRKWLADEFKRNRGRLMLNIGCWLHSVVKPVGIYEILL